ncbi:hypothetical protein LGT36_003580 [Demequina sp. TMPB413]|uniref:hypothetical protein n=1 Tax=Demequina sp. TMPB413 TaxID=2881056 RepID=UPI001CF25EB2|nr:hypothetical protein [Demequina sp. TMPB413]UPU89016.1 hypothetical protein LGT36_003580 [Demequina sp. TMPB413]
MPTRSIVVSRPVSDLNLDDGVSHELVVWNEPDLEYMRKAVRGSYQAGERLKQAVPSTMTIGGVFRCMGEDWDATDAAINEMYLALQQFSYTVTATFAGVATVYEDCQPATIRPLNGQRTRGQVESGFADYSIEIRCTPVIGAEVAP